MKRDPYRELAAERFNVKLEEVTSEQRMAAKQAAFPHVYGTRQSFQEFIKKRLEEDKA